MGEIRMFVYERNRYILVESVIVKVKDVIIYFNKLSL